MEKEFYSKINGTTFTNGQAVLKEYKDKPKELLIQLVPEPENKFDNKAIKIISDEEHIGYLPAETAHKVFDKILLGSKFTAEVSEITGGKSDKSNYGCNILVKSL